MRKFVIAAASAAVALGAAAPAFAQDRAPFTGPRIEALAGYDNLRDGSDGRSDGRDGFVYGGAIGYDVQARGLVLGVEGEVTGSTVKARTTDLLTAGDRFRLSAGRDFYAGARVGYAISPVALAYVKGGYTNARVESRYDVGTTRVEDHSNLDGYRVGAGLEYQTGRNTYVKGEYRYSHYGNLDGYDIDADRHQILAGVGLRF